MPKPATVPGSTVFHASAGEKDADGDSALLPHPAGETSTLLPTASETRPRFLGLVSIPRSLPFATTAYGSRFHLSSATSQPAARTSSYSGPDSSNMGLVLFTCTNTFRGRRNPASLRKLTSAPDTGTCPI